MNTADRLLRDSREAYGVESTFKISAIIMKEAGNIVHEELRLSDYPDKDLELRDKSIEVAIGDVLAMTQLYCSRKKKDFGELYMQGCQRAIERCSEKISGRSGF